MNGGCTLIGLLGIREAWGWGMVLLAAGPHDLIPGAPLDPQVR